MTDQGLRDLLNELATLKIQHQEEFEQWWDQANIVQEKAYALTGWLVERKLL
jgi:hypothetical protein